MSGEFMTYETYLRQQVDKGCYGVAIISAEVALDIANFIEKQRERIAEADRKTENSSEIPNNCEVKICDTCRYYNSNIPCGSTPSACKEADKFAEEFVDGLKKLKPKDEPQRDCFLCKWLGEVDVCGRCRNRNLFAEAEPQPRCPNEDCSTVPTISKMEQVDKDINVRSKDEQQTERSSE